MNLEIGYVADHGVTKDERIVLKAKEDVQVGEYMLADTTYVAENEVSNKLRHTFWIPDAKVDKGDLVVIYTKEGKSSVKVNKSGNRTYFFYWGLEKTVWNKDEDAAALFHIRDFSTKKV